MLVWIWQRWAEMAAGHAGAAPALSAPLRAALAASLNLALALCFGPLCIAWLRRRFLEPSHSPSPAVRRLHAHKNATPTLGGLFLVASVVGGLALFADWRTGQPQLATLTVVGFGVVGLVDDLKKIAGRAQGLSIRQKLAGQAAVATVAALAAYALERHSAAAGLRLAPAGLGAMHLGAGVIAVAALVMVSASNAVNLTDGLDGLAGGCLALALAPLGLLACCAGEPDWARWLGLVHSPGAGEMAVAAGAAGGALLGFLWFNCSPAAVFMGDTGALSLGALLGLVAIAARQELLLVVIGGVFVVETLSVLAQVASFRWWGRRVLLCAPLHHHFQLRGQSEHKIVARFWIAALLCACAGLATIAPARSGGMLAPTGARSTPAPSAEAASAMVARRQAR